jgi:hypothetical protein
MSAIREAAVSTVSRWLSRNARRKVDFPEVCDRFHQFDPHYPLATLNGAYLSDPAFLFSASVLIHNQNALALLYPGRERKRSSVSVHGEHVGELIEGLSENILPENMDRDGQSEPLAAPDFSAWPNLDIHAESNFEPRPARGAIVLDARARIGSVSD